MNLTYKCTCSFIVVVRSDDGDEEKAKKIAERKAKECLENGEALDLAERGDTLKVERVIIEKF